MNYRISYYSPLGHAKELAYAFRQILPSRTPVTDLAAESSEVSDIHLVGFEFSEPKFDEIPRTIRQFLSNPEHKDILLFATCPVRTDENLRMQLERNMIPLLPKSCKYHGLFLCPGAVSPAVLESLLQSEAKPRYEETKLLLREYRKSKGHPNREDIRKGWRFIADELQLNYL